ncbi:PiggyBac transposable element-derived protein 1 [Acipenser ruthenus]|uniref:PiggyBac transposable element-derived protein 1 n=1 Tax=Acipenser ruthenus TaxID=7906 RepID=A0A662YSR3_ACIRT|nr:PiggyBac transposable element-derived protein 1 [Acipenser ruthenus]
MEQLSQRIQTPNHKLFFDNFFTTYNALEVLAEKKIHVAGTARVCRFAKPPLKTDKEMSKKGQGSRNEDEVERWEQKERRFVKIKRPEVVKKYNKAMGGVDKLDQLISLYRIDIWSLKWPLCMITLAFDVAVVSSWLEYHSQRMPGHSATANHGSPRLQNDCGRSTCVRGEAPRIEKTRESEQFQHTQSMYESNSP